MGKSEHFFIILQKMLKGYEIGPRAIGSTGSQNLISEDKVSYYWRFSVLFKYIKEDPRNLLKSNSPSKIIHLNLIKS